MLVFQYFNILKETAFALDAFGVECILVFASGLPFYFFFTLFLRSEGGGGGALNESQLTDEREVCQNSFTGTEVNSKAWLTKFVYNCLLIEILLSGPLITNIIRTWGQSKCLYLCRHQTIWWHISHPTSFSFDFVCSVKWTRSIMESYSIWWGLNLAGISK